MSKIKKILTRLSIVLLLALTIVGGCYHYARSDLTFVDFSKLQVLLDGTKNIALGAAKNGGGNWKDKTSITNALVCPVFCWITSGGDTYANTKATGSTAYQGPYHVGLQYSAVTVYDKNGNKTDYPFVNFGQADIMLTSDALGVSSSTIGGTGLKSTGVTNTTVTPNRTIKLSKQEIGRTDYNEDGTSGNNNWALTYTFDTSYYAYTGYTCDWAPVYSGINLDYNNQARRVPANLTLYLGTYTDSNGVSHPQPYNYTFSESNKGGAEGDSDSLYVNLLKRNGIKMRLNYTAQTAKIKYHKNNSTDANPPSEETAICHESNWLPGALGRSYGITWVYNDKNNNNGSTYVDSTGDCPVDYTYSFKGWSIDHTDDARNMIGSTKVTEGKDSKGNDIYLFDPSSEIFPLAHGTITFTARWTKPKITLPTPTRWGYFFNGWHYNTEQFTRTGEFNEATTSDLTFTADWLPRSFKINFDSNFTNSTTGTTPSTAADGSGSTAQVSATFDAEMTMPACGYSLPGYEFVGWSSNANSKVAEYAVGDTPMFNYNMATSLGINNDDGSEAGTLYAIWKPKTYSILYKHNDADDDVTRTVNKVPEEEKTGSVTFDNSFSVQGYDIYHLYGWYFNKEKGWNTKADGNGKKYDEGGMVTLKKDTAGDLLGGDYNGKVILHAQWLPNTYKIKYKGNKPSAITHTHASSNGVKPLDDSGKTQEYEQEYVYESDYGTTPTRLDANKFYLHGWWWRYWGRNENSFKKYNVYEDKDSEDAKNFKKANLFDNQAKAKEVIDNLAFSNTAPSNQKVEIETTLYSQWEANSYTVKYDANGGKSEDGVTSITNNYLFDKDYSLEENIFSKVDENYNDTTRRNHTPIVDSYGDRYTPYSTVRNTTYKSDFEYYFLGWGFSETATTAAGVHYKDKAVFRNIPDAFDIYCDKKIDTPCNTSEHRADKAGKTYGLYAVWNAIPNLTVNSAAARFDYYEGADITATMQLFLLRK